MKVLVTGSGTLLGNTICQTLLKNGYSVIAAYRNNYPLNLKKFKQVKILKFDLSNKLKIKENFNALVHCAGLTQSNKFSLKQYLKINYYGFIKILDSLDVTRCKKIIFISTTSVYGKIEKNILNEKNKIKKDNSYGKSKLLGENYLIKFCNENNLSFAILRLPGIIGLGSKNNFLSNILSNIKNNNQLIISNIKFKFNNVIHVNNVAEIISSMLQKNFFNYLYNLGVKYPIQIINIIKIMMKFLKKDSKVNVLHKKNQPFRISLNKQLVKNFKIYSLRKSLMLFLKENSN